ncbi:MAG: nucleotidyl transferase AbiEii/AbiGii toxin family protein [Oligoflexales bacterium]
MITINKDILQNPPHLDQDGFAAALNYTRQTTGFRGELIEKDYYCSIVLAFLFSEKTPLVFKGGTCLNKVHVGFYRLSEDLDFSIPVSANATRADRRKAMEPVKRIFARIQKVVPSLLVASNLTGHNEGRQYTATLSYQSTIAPAPGTIKFEVGLREPLFERALSAQARTLLLDPFKKSDLLGAVQVSCLSAREAFAEKIRAALTRKEPAIRDLFDLDYAVQHKKIELNDAELIDQTRQKIAVPGTEPVNLSASRISALRLQLATELQPVLRSSDYGQFNFDLALSQLKLIAKALGL